MIAASEEFLREIAPRQINGHLSSLSLRGAAILAAMRITPVDGRSRTFIYVSGLQAGYEAVANVFGGLAAQTRKYRDGVRLEGFLEDGMPFVGWFVNADSRRIDGAAQPGEGDFIKYLGRE